jgi:pyruvate carboxylase
MAIPWCSINPQSGVDVQEVDIVTEGQTLLLPDAIKMNIEIQSPHGKLRTDSETDVFFKEELP